MNVLVAGRALVRRIGEVQRRVRAGARVALETADGRVSAVEGEVRQLVLLQVEGRRGERVLLVAIEASGSRERAIDNAPLT